MRHLQAVTLSSISNSYLSFSVTNVKGQFAKTTITIFLAVSSYPALSLTSQRIRYFPSTFAGFQIGFFSG